MLDLGPAKRKYLFTFLAGASCLIVLGSIVHGLTRSTAPEQTQNGLLTSTTSDGSSPGSGTKSAGSSPAGAKTVSGGSSSKSGSKNAAGGTTGGSTSTYSSGSASTSGGSAAKSKPVFVFYYLWWSHDHWTSHLGPNYPYSQTPSPLPATLDASGCGTVSNYSGNELTDVSQGLAYDQDNYQVIYSDVLAAARAGVTGFAVNWAGTGLAGQKTSDLSYSERLADVFQAVHQVDSEGYNFKIMFDYKSSTTILSLSQFQNDFAYLKATYGNDPALDHTYSKKIEIIISGAWKYTDADITSMGNDFSSNFYLIGDEKPSTWDAAAAASFEGVSYYWSSQNPYNNAASFSQLKSFAAQIRSTKNSDGSAKAWLAPFTPGYNAQILYNTPTCVPRDGTQTMHELYDGNLASDPDGWTFISWNEISEGTYIVPLTRYGDLYVNELHKVITDGS